MKFTKLSIKDVVTEEAHGGAGLRKVLVKPEHVSSPFLEAVTKGFLEKGKIFDWHLHKNVDEIFIVIKGEGKFYCQEEIIDYKSDDVITTPADLDHKIEAAEDSEFYFIRVKSI